MQNKGAIKVFAIAFAIVSLYQLSFTFVSQKIEKDAARYAESNVGVELAKELAQGDEVMYGHIHDSIFNARKTYYLDSMDNQVVYNILIDKYTYRDVKEREINLGLDLKGGMNVVLEVSVSDIIQALSGDSQDPVFVEAMQLAKQKQRDSQQDFVTLFGESFNEVDPNASLASIFLFEFKDKGITVNSTNAEVLAVIETEAEGAIDRSFQILRTRIDRFGVTQPNIQKLATSGRILVELPGIKDPKRVRKLLQGTAQLEFWETYNFSELYTFFDEANQRLAGTEDAKVEETATENEAATAENEETVTEQTDLEEDLAAATDTTNNSDTTSLIDQLADDSDEMDDASFEEYAAKNPLYAYLMPSYQQNESGQFFPGNTARVGTAAVKDTARINNMLSRVKSVFPRNMKLAWTIKPRAAGEAELMELVALKASRDNKAALGGDVIVDARQDYDQNGRVEVTIQMNSEGAKTWKRLTGENIGRQVAIVLDDYVYSYPVVNDEIPNGRSSISGGDMSITEAQDLANILKAGKLPAKSRIMEEAVVGPSLGREAVTAGLWSFVLAFGLVLIYMAFFYNKSGLVADLALFTNIFFLFGILASLGAVLTLPGIAGIVLTLGMAVDANVIIYERIKEELRAGKGMRLAIDDGYKNAYSAIIDGNVTTLLTGIVLYTFGTGPVQGFATTLIIGLLTSLFTSIFISRMIFVYLLDNNKKVTFDTKATRNFLANTAIKFLGMRKKAYVISAALIIISLGSLAVRGLNFGVDFTGGRTYLVRFDKDVTVTDIRNALAVEFTEATPEVKTFGPSRQVKITTKYMIENEGTEIDSIIQSMLFNSLQQFYDIDINYSSFTSDQESDDKLIGILSSQKIGPTIADDIRNKAITAIIISLFIIFGYIAIRFRKWQYGLAGIIALFHDTIIVLGVFSLFYNILPFSLEIDQAFIAAILTIIGYSINDTVIIFDRIRENITLHPKKLLKININDGLNSTLMRTVNTSGTTAMVLIIIAIFGGEVIRGFVFALLVGILVGTYSSVFNASPLVYDLLNGPKEEKAAAEKAELAPKGKKK
ncbi:MAG: protein translocase subunit SecDF [Bacteroidetes bacterium]|nr:protein translocase subunit SecDF [Bacteroidota bacterium]MBU1580062.1 protein translocase subunit SecDF [Bacteroidota bacterium]MBU2556186.1 protein translocase subunit SecDF [Bacteroidota bacterium]